jgi:hypothetical protein
MGQLCAATPRINVLHYHLGDVEDEVGLYTLNPVDP